MIRLFLKESPKKGLIVEPPKGVSEEDYYEVLGAQFSDKNVRAMNVRIDRYGIKNTMINCDDISKIVLSD